MSATCPIRVLHLSPDPAWSSGITDYAGRFRAAVEQAGVRITPLVVPAAAGASGPPAIRRYAKAARAALDDSYDLVHAELGGGALREFYAARALAHANSVPVCATLHDPPRAVWWPFHVGGVREQRVLRAAVSVALSGPARRIDLNTLSAASHLFVLSETGAASLRREVGPALPPLTVLPYPVSPGPSTADPASREPPREELCVGFFGHWYPGKRIEDIIAAVRALRDERPTVCARLFGDALTSGAVRPATRYRDALIDRIHRQGLTDLIRICGAIPADRVTAELARCDAIILPYGTPRTAVGLASTSAAAHDALLAGTPVITTRTRSLAELVRHGENGLLFAPGDVAALIDQLRALRDDRALRSRLRVGAERSAAAMRGRDPGVAAATAYAEVLAGSRGRRRP